MEGRIHRMTQALLSRTQQELHAHSRTLPNFIKVTQTSDFENTSVEKTVTISWRNVQECVSVQIRRKPGSMPARESCRREEGQVGRNGKALRANIWKSQRARTDTNGRRMNEQHGSSPGGDSLPRDTYALFDQRPALCFCGCAEMDGACVMN